MRSRAATLAATLAVGLVYLALLAWVVPLNGLWSGDQGPKIIQVISLIQHRFRSGVIVTPSASLDPEGAFSPLPMLFTWKQGAAYYSIFSYPHAALTAPWFFLFGYAGLFVVPIFSTLATLWLAALISERLGWRWSWAIPLIIGLATPVGFYAIVFWEHALATAVTMGSIACALVSLSATERRWRYTLAAGVLAGLAWWFRAECLWLGPALVAGLVLAGVGWPALAGALAGVALGLVPLLIFNLLTFGMPLGPQVAVNYPGMSASLPGALLARRAPILMTMLVDGTGLQLGWLLAAFAIACAAAWSERWRAWLLAAAAAACLAYLYGPTAHLLHTGVLATCPFILIALAALRPALFRQPPSRLVLVVGLVFMVGVLLTTPNDGGAQWGPRYLLPALTLLVVVGLAGLSHAGPAPRLARRAALALLLAAGLTVQAQGVQFLQDSTTKSLRVVQVVNAQPAQPVLTDIWYAPQLLAPLYVERTILYLYRPEQMPAFSAMLRQRGILRFSYLTAQPWERDSQLPSGSGATCTRLEGLWYGLNLLDCTIVL